MVDCGRVPLWVPLYMDMDIWVRLSTVDLEEGRVLQGILTSSIPWKVCCSTDVPFGQSFEMSSVQNHDWLTILGN